MVAITGRGEAVRPLTRAARRADGTADRSREVRDMEIVLEIGYWLLRSGVQAPRHVAAILTATAIPFVVALLLLDSDVTGEFGTTVLILSIVCGIGFAVTAEGLGTGPHKWRDWSVVIVGAVLGLAAAVGFVVFLGIFGTMAGLYVAAAAGGVWLVLRLFIAVVHRWLARRQRPA